MGTINTTDVTAVTPVSGTPDPWDVTPSQEATPVAKPDLYQAAPTGGILGSFFQTSAAMFRSNGESKLQEGHADEALAALQIAYSLGDSSPQIIADLARASAAGKDFGRAVDYGRDFLKQNGEGLISAYDVADWARSDADPVTAYQLGLKDIPVSEWIDAAKKRADAGDFVLAEKILVYARKLNQGDTPNSITIGFSMKAKPSDEEVTARAENEGLIDPIQKRIDVAFGRVDPVTGADVDTTGKPSPVLAQVDAQLATSKTLLNKVNPQKDPALYDQLETENRTLGQAKAAMLELDQVEPRIAEHDVSKMVREGQAEIAFGTLYKNERVLQRGLHKLEVLKRVAAAEDKKLAMINRYAQEYPQRNVIHRSDGGVGPFDFQTDFTANNPSVAPYIVPEGYVTGAESNAPMGADLKTFQELPFVQVKNWLEVVGAAGGIVDAVTMGTTDVAHLGVVNERVDAMLQATRMSNIVYDYKTNSWVGNKLRMSWNDSLAVDDDAVGLDEVDRYEMVAIRTEETFQAAELDECLKIVDSKKTADQSQNEGYRTRTEAGDALKSLDELSLYPLALEDAAQKGIVAEDYDGIVEVRDYAVKRAENYRNGLQKTLELQKKIEEHALPTSLHVEVKILEWTGANQDLLGDMQKLDKSPAVIDLESRIAEADEEITALKGLTFDKNNADAFRKDFDVLRGHMPAVIGFEEAGLRRSQENWLQLADKVDSDGDKIQTVRDSFASLDGASTIQDRLKIYHSIAGELDYQSQLRTMNVRIKMLEEMRKSVKTSDRIITPLKWGVEAMAYMQDVNIGEYKPATRDFDAMLKEYKATRDAWQSRDTGRMQEGKTRFDELNEADIWNDLQRDYGLSTKLNEYTIGVGIVIAASLTGGLAGGFAGSFFAGTAVEGAVALGANAIVFTVTNRALTALAEGDWDPLSNILGHPGKFAEEVFTNAMMMKFLGGSEWLGGKLKLGTIGKGVLEVGTLQLWNGVILDAYEKIKRGEPVDLVAAFGKSFSGEALKHSALFVLSMRAGGVLSMPITNLTHGVLGKFVTARYGKDIKALEESRKEYEKDLKDFAEMRIWDPAKREKLLNSLENTLKRQKLLLDRLPSSVFEKDPYFRQLYKANAEMTEDMNHYRERSTEDLRLQKDVFGKGNVYGARISSPKSSEGEGSEGSKGYYRAGTGEAFVKTLIDAKSDSVRSVSVGDNGVVTVELMNADRRDVVIRFRPEGELRSGTVDAMKKAVSDADKTGRFSTMDAGSVRPATTADTVPTPAAHLNFRGSEVPQGAALFEGPHGFVFDALKDGPAVYQRVTIRGRTFLLSVDAQTRTYKVLKYFGPKGGVAVREGNVAHIVSHATNPTIDPIDLADNTVLVVDGHKYTFVTADTVNFEGKPWENVSQQNHSGAAVPVAKANP